MATLRQVRQLAELARDLDMVVYKLEREPPESAPSLESVERRRLRRELERLRDQLNEVVRELE